jgi:hypothetical protein
VLTITQSSLSLAPPPLRIQPPPDKLHPTLASWLKNMNKSKGLINRLQDLASSPHDLRERTARLLSEAPGISKNVASVKGQFSYESIPVIPITDRGGNFCFRLIRIATVQNHVQGSLGFRTEDYV